MRGYAVVLVTTAALSLPPPAAAQFGGLFSKPKPAPATTAADQRCADKPQSSGSRMMKGLLGNMIGSATSQVTGSMGIVGSWLPSAEVAGLLTDAIACKLDPAEQKQAADATVAATRGEKVGETVEWQSSSRPNVTGRSTVTAKSAAANGGTCMTVTDVVIVEGEETTVAKRMCKIPPATGYTIAAA